MSRKPLWSYKSKRIYHILIKFQLLDHKDLFGYKCEQETEIFQNNSR